MLADIKEIKVPGAFELPYIAQNKLLTRMIVRIMELTCIITLGCVIKGETAHFEYHFWSACANTISSINVTKSQVPIMFGVITAYTKSQALNRSQIKFDR